MILGVTQYRLPNRLGGQLSLNHYPCKEAKASVLLLHGLGGTARQFGDHQQGFINFCLAQGLEVFTLELHGHGQSWPSVSSRTRYGINDVVEHDLALFMKHIDRLAADVPRFLVGQGFAGVLWLAYMARFPDAKVQGMLHLGWLGSSSNLPTPSALFHRLRLSVLAPIFGRVLGYLPAWLMGRGSAEALDLFKQAQSWMRGQWCDPKDEFPYWQRLSELSLPPSLYVTDGGEHARIRTARQMMRNLGQHDCCLLVLDQKSRKGVAQLEGSLQTPEFADNFYPILSTWFGTHLTATEI